MTEAHGYLIVIERAADGGFGAWAPDLPGCIGLGDTVEDATRDMREAITLHLQGMREDGEQVPVPSTVATAYVDVDAA